MPGALAAGAGVLVYFWCWSLAEQEPVVVALHSVAPGQVIRAADVTTRWLPTASEQAGVLRSTRAVVGQRAGTGLVAGQAILQGHLANQSALATALKRGERAVFVPVAAGGPVGGALVAGDLVDLVGVRGESAEWLARGARVLAVAADDGDGGSSVVVAVSEQSTPLVAAAVLRGDVTLVLAPVEKEMAHGTTRAGG